MVNLQQFLSVSPLQVQRWVRDYHSDSPARDVTNPRSALRHKQQYTEEEAAFRILAIEAEQQDFDDRIIDPSFVPLANKHLGLFLRTSLTSCFSMPTSSLQRNNLLSEISRVSDQDPEAFEIAYQLLVSSDIPVGSTMSSDSEEFEVVSTKFPDLPMNVTAQEFIDVVRLCFRNQHATIGLLSLWHPDFEDLFEALTSQELVILLCMGTLPCVTLGDKEDRVERYKCLTDDIPEELQNILIQSGTIGNKLEEAAITTLVSTQQSEMAALSIAPLTSFEEVFIQSWIDEGSFRAIARNIGMRVPKDIDVEDYLLDFSPLYICLDRNDFEKLSRFGVLYSNPYELDDNLARLSSINSFFVLRAGVCSNEDPVSLEDVSPPTVAFGTKTSYTCLSASALLELIDVQRANTMNPVTQEVMSIRQTYDVLELLRMYSQELGLTQEEKDKTVYLLQALEEDMMWQEMYSLSEEETRKLRSFLFSVFNIGMRMRGWKGSGPYPTLKETIRTITEEEEQAIVQEVFALQEQLENAPKIQRFVSTVPVYGLGDEEIVQKPSTLIDLLFKVDQDCIRILSTEFIVTAYMALKNRFNEDIPGLSLNDLFSTVHSVDELEELLSEAPQPDFQEFNLFLEKKNQAAHEELVNHLLPRTGSHKNTIRDQWDVDPDVLYRLAIDFFDEVKNEFPSFRMLPELAFAAKYDLQRPFMAIVSITEAPTYKPLEVALEHDSFLVLERANELLSPSQIDFLFDRFMSRIQQRKDNEGKEPTIAQRRIAAALAPYSMVDEDRFVQLLRFEMFDALEALDSNDVDDIVDNCDLNVFTPQERTFIVNTFDLSMMVARKMLQTALEHNDKQTVSALSQRWEQLQQLKTQGMEKESDELFYNIMGI